MTTTYVGAFADGKYTFHLPMPRVVAVEREADASIFEVFHWLGENMGSIELGPDERAPLITGPTPATLKQVHRIIKHALIGGGEVNESQVDDLIEVYCYPARPAVYDMELAYRILDAAIYGVQLKKNSEEIAQGDDAADSAADDSTRDRQSSTAESSD